MDNNNNNNRHDFSTFIKVIELLKEQGATGITISLPKIDEVTKKRHDIFGAWYYGASGAPRVLMLPAIDWAVLSDETRQKIVTTIAGNQ